MYSFLYKGLLRLLATLAATSSRRGGSLLPIVRKTSRQTPIYILEKDYNMLDQYNRSIDYLRISLTDRCNLHCQYCQPDVTEYVAHENILRYEEILRICQAAVRLGIHKFKITGGEPLVRNGCADFIAKLKQVEGVEQVTLTTNGTLLSKFLPELLAAGVDSVNISLDTTDAEQYNKLTGGDINEALAGIEAAKRVGLPFKLNCVPLQGMSIDEIMRLLQFAEGYQASLRFIELMPLACNSSLQGLAGVELRAALRQQGVQLTPDAVSYGNGPAQYYRLSGYKIPIGFIEPIHNRFCAACNRVRLTSVGFLKTCLYSNDGINLAQLIRNGISDGELEQKLRQTIFMKPWGHKFDVQPAGFKMSQIGG